jgi:two-component system sensor histidine kinase/response regulator
MSSKAHILIVEDLEENIDVLSASLEDEFEISVAVNGQLALEQIEQHQPDLILLDIQMPLMDGYEVCRHLKSNPATSKIPVMFLTALTEEGAESKGLLLGAVDYIYKPFNPYLVKARVRNQIELKKYKDQLEELVRERTQRLKEAHEKLRLIDATKNDFLGAISHELRTPANGVLGVAQIALDYIEDEFMKDELTKLFEIGSKRLLETIDNALLLAKLQTSDEEMEVEDIDLSSIVDAEFDNVALQLKEKRLDVRSELFSDYMIRGNAQIMRQIVVTLMRMAVLMAKENSQLLIRPVQRKTQKGITLEVEGHQFSDDLIETIFEPFSYERASSYLAELGLGLPLADKMAKVFGGTLAVGNLGKQGVWITLLLPDSFF